MSSPPVSPKPTRGVRSYIRNKYDKYVRSHSRSPSAGASTSIAQSTYPPPQVQGSLQSTNSTLAPPTAEEAAALRHAQSTTTSSAPDIATTSDSRSEKGPWDSLGGALQALHNGAGLFPPLQSAVGALIACLDVLKVCRGY